MNLSGRDATFPFLNGFPFFFLQNQKIPFFFNSRHENFPFLNGTPFFQIQICGLRVQCEFEIKFGG